MLVPGAWVEIMDTSGIFDDAPDLQLVISPLGEGHMRQLWLA
jgi:hypothetical protein